VNEENRIETVSSGPDFLDEQGFVKKVPKKGIQRMGFPEKQKLPKFIPSLAVAGYHCFVCLHKQSISLGNNP